MSGGRGPPRGGRGGGRGRGGRGRGGPGAAGEEPEHPVLEWTLPTDRLHFVDRSKGWRLVVPILDAATAIALDSETRPQFQKGAGRNKAALLQIACRDARGVTEVILLDLLRLAPAVYSPDLQRVFEDRSVRKIGQGFSSDLRDLQESHPSAACFRVMHNVIEPDTVSRRVLPPAAPRSLKKLVGQFLHRRLTKAQQMSNWAKRPLTQAQIRYASQDALVLLLLLDELERLTGDASPLARSIGLGQPGLVCEFCGREFPDEAGVYSHQFANVECREGLAEDTGDRAAFEQELLQRLALAPGGRLAASVVGSLPGWAPLRSRYKHVRDFVLASRLLSSALDGRRQLWVTLPGAAEEGPPGGERKETAGEEEEEVEAEADFEPALERALRARPEHSMVISQVGEVPGWKAVKRRFKSFAAWLPLGAPAGKYVMAHCGRSRQMLVRLAESVEGPLPTEDEQIAAFEAALVQRIEAEEAQQLRTSQVGTLPYWPTVRGRFRTLKAYADASAAVELVAGPSGHPGDVLLRAVRPKRRRTASLSSEGPADHEDAERALLLQLRDQGRTPLSLVGESALWKQVKKRHKTLTRFVEASTDLALEREGSRCWVVLAAQ